MHKLVQHPEYLRPNHKVFVDYSLTNDCVEIQFKVETDKLITSNDFKTNGFENWGLWNFDVVEVFLQKSSQTDRYLELQVSPLGQKLAIDIFKPREDHRIKVDYQGTMESMITPFGFDAKFSVPLNEIPGDDKVVFGNFTACLGLTNRRSYSAISINDEDKEPDFHIPRLFQKLGEL